MPGIVMNIPVMKTDVRNIHILQDVHHVVPINILSLLNFSDIEGCSCTGIERIYLPKHKGNGYECRIEKIFL
jgi:hypothetical protein